MPGCNDIITNEYSGLLVPVRDEEKLKSAIKKYIHNPELAIEYGINARKTVSEKYTVEIINNQILKVYDEILKKKMIFYFLPFAFLTILTLIESSKRFKFIINNQYFYYLIALFFIFFIGLRYEVGCDWEQYKDMFRKYNSLTLSGLIESNFFSEKKFQELGHIFITRISQNIYVLNLIYSTLFSLPLFYFCSKLKSKYFSLLISYPYYIIVVGMGPIRQAACTSFLMISIIYLSNKKYYRHLFLTIISLLIHQFQFFSMVNFISRIPSN